MLKKPVNYFSRNEIILWCSSMIFVVMSFFIFDRENYLTINCIIDRCYISYLQCQREPFGQFLMIIFSLLYGIISFTFAYYGEMLTYLGMTMPMAIFALISWLRNPYNGNKSEVKVNSISKKETAFMWVITIAIAAVFYFILEIFNTAYIIPSTISVATSFLAVYLTFRRSSYYALAYAANDVVLLYYGYWQALLIHAIFR